MQSNIGLIRTLMIATLSPASYNYEETLSTLRYANRAKSIKNKPVINEDPKDAMLREYETEIVRLRQALEARQKGIPTTIVKKVVKKTKKVKKRDSKSSKNKKSLEQANQETEISEGSVDDQSEADSQSEEEVEENMNPLAILDPETIARLQQEVEDEKKELLASKDMVVEEKQRIAAELEKRANDLENERQERELLAIKLQAMEGKLLIGGVNIEDKINEQERELQEAELRLQEEQRRKRILEKRLESKQEAQLQLEENFSSLQEEVDVKTKKLNKLISKLQEVTDEINDLKDEFRNEREDVLDTVRELSRELSLKITITENFIPKEEITKLEQLAVYDEEKDDWMLKRKPSSLRGKRLPFPVSVPTLKRPICQYAKLILPMGDPNIRYRAENITTLQVT